MQQIHALEPPHRGPAPAFLGASADGELFEHDAHTSPRHLAARRCPSPPRARIAPAVIGGLLVAAFLALGVWLMGNPIREQQHGTSASIGVGVGSRTGTRLSDGGAG